MLPVELKVLAWAGLLLTLQYLLMSVSANRDFGWRWTTSPRDAEPDQPMRPVTGRLVRALQNMFEALIFYTLAAVLVTLADRSNAVTELLAWTFLAARVAYLPAYAFGWTVWRSAIWGLGFLATLGMVLMAML